MIGLEVNDAVVMQQSQVLEQALSTNPKTQKALQKLIDKAPTSGAFFYAHTPTSVNPQRQNGG